MKGSWASGRDGRSLDGGKASCPRGRIAVVSASMPFLSSTLNSAADFSTPGPGRGNRKILDLRGVEVI